MNVTYPKYSVLMSVYSKENPEWLRIAVNSMLKQTVLPSEFVIVEDGALTKDLYGVIHEFTSTYPELFKIISYRDNKGLGYALQQGILACSMPIIARMDSDDWSCPERLEMQLSYMYEQQLDMVGSQVSEFMGKPDNVIALTKLPEKYVDIIKYSKRRNPFRHPAIIYKKNEVLAAGNYNADLMYFEDWDLFNRMLKKGSRAANVDRPLVAMRVNGNFYARRGGLQYLKYTWNFMRNQMENRWFSLGDLFYTFIPRAIICLAPNKIRNLIYNQILRKKKK